MTATEFIASLSEQAREAITSTCARRLPPSPRPPILVILPIIGPEESQVEYTKARTALSKFRHRGTPVTLIEGEIPGSAVKCYLPLPGSEVLFRCLALETTSVEGAKDTLKEVLWPVETKTSQTREKAQVTASAIQQTSTAFRTLIENPNRTQLLSETRPLTRHRSLDHHCILGPSTIPRPKEITTHSFDHGGGHFYRYRLCLRKLQGLGHPIIPLSAFLLGLSHDCPNHFFKIGPRISATQWNMSPTAEAVPQSPLPELARKALEQGRFKGAHDNVEVFALEEDPGAIAVEIPIWWERGEMGPFQKCFQPTGPLTGHVDILRVCGDAIEVWDYKPDAETTTTAGMQVFLYALVLAVRTGLPLTRFLCGYFDTHTAWTFLPAFADMRPTA